MFHIYLKKDDGTIFGHKNFARPSQALAHFVLAYHMVRKLAQLPFREHNSFEIGTATDAMLKMVPGDATSMSWDTGGGAHVFMENIIDLDRELELNRLEDELTNLPTFEGSSRQVISPRVARYVDDFYRRNNLGTKQ